MNEFLFIKFSIVLVSSLFLKMFSNVPLEFRPYEPFKMIRPLQIVELRIASDVLPILKLYYEFQIARKMNAFARGSEV